MYADLDFTDHAFKRMARRDLTEEDIEYVYLFGRKIFCGGVLHIFLGNKDIPHGDKRRDQLARLEGTILVIESKARRTVITVYRNRKGIRDIRRKTKRFMTDDDIL